MNKYKIEIQEIYLRKVNIEAGNINEAIEKVHHLYMNNKFSPQGSNLISYKVEDGILAENKETLMKEIVSYLYEDEKKHYDEYGEDKPKNHIYLKLEEILNMFD